MKGTSIRLDGNCSCSEVLWSGEGTSERLCLTYPDISLHAVSRDVSAFPRPCLYMLCADPESTGSSEEEPTDTDECPTQVEVRLVLESSEDCKCMLSFYCML